MDMDEIAAMQREMFDRHREAMRAEQRHKYRTLRMQIAMQVALSGEAGIMYATLNPDPRVLECAIKHAETMRALGLAEMDKIASEATP